MLGNLVYPDHQDKTIVKVIGVGGGVVHFRYPDNSSGWHFADHIQPIPIERDMWQKSGFEERGPVLVLADDFYDILVHELTDSIWTVTYHNCEMSLPDQRMHISYVHELQNFLSMCGVEKEIVL